MNNYVRATVESNSIDDKYFRVKIKAEGFWDTEVLTPVLNSIPLKVGDVVVVDVSQGFEYPIVVGKWFDDNYKTHSDAGQVLAESEGSSGWTVVSINQNNLVLKNSEGISVEIGDVIRINGGSLGGLIKINELVKKLNEVVLIFNSHTHDLVIPTSMALMPKVQMKSINKSDIEDTKVIH